MIDWKRCPICKFDIFNGNDFIHHETGNYHINCLVDHYSKTTKKIRGRIGDILRKLLKLKRYEIVWDDIGPHPNGDLLKYNQVIEVVKTELNKGD